MNPNLADAHADYGANLLFKIGRQQEGIREVRKAVELDLLSVRMLLALTYLLVNDGRGDEAWES